MKLANERQLNEKSGDWRCLTHEKTVLCVDTHKKNPKCTCCKGDYTNCDCRIVEFTS